MQLYLAVSAILIYNCTEYKSAHRFHLASLASQLDRSWNTLLPDLICLGDKLEALGFRYFDNKIVMDDLENEENT